MSTNNRSQGAQGEKTYFEQQRELVLQDVATNLEQVLQNMNTLNRSLESVIAVGNEFGQVEGLWSMFENVMAQQQQQSHEEEGQTHTGAQEKSQRH
ncbi:DASH complex subunit Dad1 [Aureobasidium namibiae CBS 147.97]|uniref:DASH complex subunit DAD1 n=1 Tax=Aureobasidium namibiae CBS 147.97 TaxID=1043004 RepID=A0A074WQT9_9PEZI